MEYRKSKYVGSYNVDEVFEGSPQEILELMAGMKAEEDDEELIYDTEEAINFIQNRFNEEGEVEITKGVIAQVLNFEEDYMRGLGIIQD